MANAKHATTKTAPFAKTPMQENAISVWEVGFYTTESVWRCAPTDLKIFGISGANHAKREQLVIIVRCAMNRMDGSGRKMIQTLSASSAPLTPKSEKANLDSNTAIFSSVTPHAPHAPNLNPLTTALIVHSAIPFYTKEDAERRAPPA